MTVIRGDGSMNDNVKDGREVLGLREIPMECPRCGATIPLGDPHEPYECGSMCCWERVGTIGFAYVFRQSDNCRIIEALRAENERLRADFTSTLQNIYRNDKTCYLHHEPRPWDGKKPGELTPGSSIFLTPREIARAVLRKLGAEVPDRFRELEAERQDGESEDPES